MRYYVKNLLTLIKFLLLKNSCHFHLFGSQFCDWIFQNVLKFLVQSVIYSRMKWTVTTRCSSGTRLMSLMAYSKVMILVIRKVRDGHDWYTTILKGNFRDIWIFFFDIHWKYDSMKSTWSCLYDRSLCIMWWGEILEYHCSSIMINENWILYTAIFMYQTTVPAHMLVWYS